jgi:hypothetical protein
MRMDRLVHRFELIPVNLKSYPLEKLLHFLKAECTIVLSNLAFNVDPCWPIRFQADQTDSQLLSCKVPNISATRLQQIPDKDLQETPFVGVLYNIDYLRFGNVNFNDNSQTIQDQELC